MVNERREILSFFLYMMAAAWQDGRRKSVSGWLFLFFFSHFFVAQICQKAGVDMEKLPASFWFHGMSVNARIMALGMGSLFGGILFLISKCSQGALGEGDGIFFIIAGIYLGFWKNLVLFFSALLLCSFFGLALLVWGRMQGKDYRKKTLPFLVFTLPMGIYLIWL